MRSDYYAKPDSSRRVRYCKGDEEDESEWDESEGNLYDNPEEIMNDQTDFQSQEPGPHSQDPAPGCRRCFRGAAVCLGLLCLLMMAGLSVLFVHSTLENDELQNRFNNLSDRCNQSLTEKTKLQHQITGLEEEQLLIRYNSLNQSYTLLQNQHRDVEVRYNKLQDEMKQLKNITEGTLCPEGWKRFGSSCYFKSTKKRSWFDSRRQCENKCSDLVIISSSEEQEFISGLRLNEESWIGLKTRYREGRYQWEWVDESTPTGTFWETSQMENASDMSYAACCDQHGRWKQNGNDDMKTWICEKTNSCCH